MSERGWAQWWINSWHLLTCSHHASLWPLLLVCSGYQLKYVLKITSGQKSFLQSLPHRAMVSAEQKVCGARLSPLSICYLDTGPLPGCPLGQDKLAASSSSSSCWHWQLTVMDVGERADSTRCKPSLKHGNNYPVKTFYVVGQKTNPHREQYKQTESCNSLGTNSFQGGWRMHKKVIQSCVQFCADTLEGSDGGQGPQESPFPAREGRYRFQQS